MVCPITQGDHNKHSLQQHHVSHLTYAAHDQNALSTIQCNKNFQWNQNDYALRCQ